MRFSVVARIYFIKQPAISTPISVVVLSHNEMKLSIITKSFVTYVTVSLEQKKYMHESAAQVNMGQNGLVDIAIHLAADSDGFANVFDKSYIINTGTIHGLDT